MKNLRGFFLAKDEVVPTKGHLAVLGEKYTALEHHLTCGCSAEVSTEDGFGGNSAPNLDVRQN